MQPKSPIILLQRRRNANILRRVSPPLRRSLHLTPPLFIHPPLRVLTARNTRRDNRRRECDAGPSSSSSSDDITAVLQLDVARGEEVAVLEPHEAGAAGGAVGVCVCVCVCFVGVDVDVGALAAVEARVGEGGEWGDADADEAGRDFGGAPEEDLGLVVGYVGAGGRFDADGEADDAEGGGAVDGCVRDGWGLLGVGFEDLQWGKVGRSIG